MGKRYSDGGWIVLPMCKPGATAPPGGRPGLWRVAEHARSGARADLMMSLPVAECSNGLWPISIERGDRTPSHPRDLSNRLRTLRAPTRITTPQTLADSYAVSDVLTHHILDPEPETDLGAEYDRSRAGLRPISARNSTDLGKGGGRRMLAQSGRRTRSEPASIRALRPRVGAINSPSTWTGAESVSRMIASVPRRRVTRPSARAGSE